MMRGKMRLIVTLTHEVSRVSIKSSTVWKAPMRQRKGGMGVRTLCRDGRLKEALGILQVTDCSDIWIESNTFLLLLQACANMKALAEGKQVHAHMFKTGLGQNLSLENKLVVMYAKCGIIEDSRQVFDKMSERNVVSWAAMIGEYTRCGHSEEALALFYQMKDGELQPDNFIFAGVLKACAGLGALQPGKEIHDYIAICGVEPDVFVSNCLVEMYVKCGMMDYARQVFDKMPERNVVSWNVMIGGYARNGHGEMALELFHKMIGGGLNPSPVTISSVLPACANLGALQQGKEIHGCIIRNGFNGDILVGNALLDMYGKCGRIEDACQVFGKMSQKDVVSWNSMIACYAQNGRDDEALKLFQKMRLAGVKANVVSWTAVIAGNAQSGQGKEALKLFQQMQLAGIKPDIVSWNAMITGFLQKGHGYEALKVFREMQFANVKSNAITIASVLPACSSLATLQQGKEIHNYIIRSGFKSDVFVESALVDMYAKCGNLEDAWQVFTTMSYRNVVSWNAMIAGCAMHGHGQDALTLFDQMQQADIMPDSITFTGILSACSHAGMVDEGWQYFESMRRDYRITPSAEHYACMVDLLARRGCFNEAQKLINMMPLKPNACVWGALLGACIIHCNIELGEYVAERLFEAEPENSGNYVLLSNAYAQAGRWDDVVKVRKMMKEKGLKKIPGCSLIEIKNKVHTFLAEDRSHPQKENLWCITELGWADEGEWYVPDINFLLHGVHEVA